MYRRIGAIVVTTLIAVAILAFMLWRAWDDLLTAIAHMVPQFLILAVLFCMAGWFIRGFRYRFILGKLAIRVTTLFATACIMVSQTANLIVPARLGDVIRVFILKHEENATYSQGISSIVVERLFDLVTVAVIGLIALIFVLDVPDWFLTVIVVPLAISVGVLAFVGISGRIRSENRYLKMLITMLAEIRAASLSIGAIAALSVLSAVIWGTDIMVCAWVAAMFQVDIPIAVIVLAIVIGNLVKAVPLTPGGVGTYEIAVALTLELGGVSPSVAALIAIIDHLIKNLITLAGGIISMYALGDWVVGVVKGSYKGQVPDGDQPGP